MTDDPEDSDPKEADRRVVPMPRKDGARRRCPICQAPTLHRFRPFCSQRCADVDLGRWVKGNYRIPTEEAPEGAAPEGPAPEGGAPAERSDEDL